MNNDDINTLDFALVERQFAALFAVDSEKRQKLSEASPPPGAQGVWNNHAGSEL